MKKVTFCLAFLLVLCGCAANKEPVLLEQDVQYIRAGSYTEGVDFPTGNIFKTEEEFNQYKNEHSFFDYSEATFDFSSYDMLFIAVQEPSGSIRHRVVEVSAGKNETSVKNYSEATFHVCLQVCGDSHIIEL